jgi:hypothetical protein
MEVIREAEIDDTKSDVERLAERAKAATGMGPLAQIKAELIQAVGSAEKPATLPRSASTRTAKADLNNAEPLLSSIVGPCLPDAPEASGPILPRFGHAPTPPREDSSQRGISPARRAADGH